MKYITHCLLFSCLKFFNHQSKSRTTVVDFAWLHKDIASHSKPTCHGKLFIEIIQGITKPNNFQVNIAVTS